jgi:hypothetical protein
MDWLAFSISALAGLTFGALLGVNLADHVVKTFSAKIWAEIMHKRVDVERTLTQAEQALDLQRKGGFDLGQR